MTEDQKAEIIQLRNHGLSYSRIAEALHLTRNQVISFCRRNGMMVCQNPIATSAQMDGSHCKNCGAPIKQQSGRKPVLFCSNKCCQSWWNHHPEMVRRNPTAIYHYVCKKCGKPFTAYGNRHRKYCSHACYIADRFGGDPHD